MLVFLSLDNSYLLKKSSFREYFLRKKGKKLLALSHADRCSTGTKEILVLKEHRGQRNIE